jgi:hypothetical protein
MGSGPKALEVSETSPSQTQITSQVTSLSTTEDSFSFIFTVPSTGSCKQVIYNFNLTGFDNLDNSSTIPYSLTIEN